MNQLLKLRFLFTVLVAGFICFSTNIYSQKREIKEAHVYMTAEKTSNLLSDLNYVALQPLEQPDEDYPTIMIDPNKTFQSIIGFGGAFTDASAINFAKLSKANQEKFLKASFDPVTGNGYTLCRTTIHSCDYSDEMYTYDSVSGDTKLEHFSIAHDLKYRLPFMQRALKTAGGNIKIFASPWSPPAWMKTNDNMLYGGKLKPEYDQTWADYFAKYIKAYKKAGVPIWGVTVQNEAMATQVWESCIYTAKEEKNFVRDYLGPTLKKNGLSNIKIMIWDHNRGIMYQRAQVAYDDPKASQYIWGMAYHWYVGNHFDNVRIVHDAFPDKHLIFSEGATSGSWNDAVRIAKNMIMDLNNWAEGWTFWNFLLDQNGGPRHAGGEHGTNIAQVNTHTGELTLNPPYYVMGQFSRFIKPGAKRIACTSNSDDFIATAFVNPNGKIAVVILNLSNADRNFQVWLNGQVARYLSPAHGVITMVF